MSDVKDLIKKQVKRSVHAVLIEPVNSDVDNDTNISINTSNDTSINTDKNISANTYIDNYKTKTLFTDLHTRQTYYIDNELLEELNSLIGDNKRVKSKFINDALRNHLALVKNNNL